MNASPTRIATHIELCPRKGWFSSGVRLPDGTDPSKRDVGTALHAACERWLRADDQGRSPDGSPVDPFPKGWDLVKDDHDRGPPRRLSIRDSVMIRRVFWAGVDAGVLRRLPDREVEVAYERPVDVGSEPVVVRGRIDQRNSDTLEDHKSTGSRRWALGPGKLRTDVKMLCYAREHFLAYPRQDSVLLRLNYFSKDPREEPWDVEVRVTRAEVDAFWDDQVVPALREMLSYEGVPEDGWRSVEGPRVEGACQAYGGCPYARVCGGMTSPQELRRQRSHESMSIFDRGKKSTTTAVATAEATVTEAMSVTVPPWTNPGCQACKGTGVSSKGIPCRACDVVAERTPGRRASGAFRTWTDETGFRWEETATPEVAQAAPTVSVPVTLPTEPATTEPEPPKRKRGRQKKEPAKEPKDESGPESFVPLPPGTTVAVQVVNVDAPLPLPAADAAIVNVLSRNGKAVVETLTALQEPLRLFVRCAPVSPANVILLANVLADEGAELAKAKGVESFWLVNAFERRDMLCARAKEIAETLRGADVVMLGETPDLRTLYEALVPFAREIVVGT